MILGNVYGFVHVYVHAQDVELVTVLLGAEWDAGSHSSRRLDR